MNGSGVGFPHLYLAVPADAKLPATHWAEALLRERSLRADSPAPSHPLRSLFVGGEAPERLGAALPDRVRQVVGSQALDGMGEWTVELSDPRMPGPVIDAWILGGVTRLSLRSAAAAPSAVDRMAELCAGRAALGVDLLLDSVGCDAMQARVNELVGLGVSSLALVEPDSSTDPERHRDAWLAAIDGIRRAGWSFLDLAFAFRTAPCPVHPRAITGRNPILGLGPGAVTFRHPRRRWNHADSHTYLEAIDSGEDPMAGGERLTGAEGRLERCWTALRSARGLRLAGLSCASAPWVARWERAFWIRSGATAGGLPHRLRLTPEGWLMADALAVELAVELERIPPGGSTDHSEFLNFEE